MSLSTSLEPLPRDDEAIRRALDDAHLPTLLVALAQWSGDLSLLREDLVPDTSFVAEAPYTEEQAARARALIFETLLRLRDAGLEVSPAPDRDALRRMLDHLSEGGATDDYLPLLREELALDGADARAPGFRKEEIAPDTSFRVAVVGAGMSGLLAAHRLKQAGVPFVVFDKNDEVGGTWLENRYPGCRVDVPNAFYSYSFVEKNDWPHFFSTRNVLLDYFRDCADLFGVREQIRFRTEVVSAHWSDEQNVWSLRIRGADGGEQTLEFQALVSAVGQLNRPKLPELPGLERFAGPRFHSADWDTSLDLAGKKVGVVGTGASAAQFVPHLATTASELRIFQRTPNWMLPTPDYHEAIPTGMTWLFRRVPHYAQWYRFSLFWRMADGILPMVRVEKDWAHPERSVGAANDELRAMLTEYFRESLAAAPELIEKVVPGYAPASKRIICDNGSWVEALLRDNVELLSDGIREVTETGIVDESGRHHELDVLIFATGFQPSKFLSPMRITGRGGLDLHEHWDGDARAYLGITVPGFPNLFCLYGPNTNIVVNGSIIYFSECEVRYLLGCIKMLLEGGHRALDCRPEVHDAYNQRVDRGNLQMAWGVATVNTWYQNEKGRVAQNWPFSLLEYWQQTRHPNPADYEFLSPAGADANPQQSAA